MGIIGSIRKHSGVAVAVVGIAIVAFIIGDLTKNQRGIPEVGKIADQTITRAHFDALNAEMENQYRQQTGQSQIASETEYQIREQVWQNLVQEVLTGREMEKLGISVSVEELSDMYAGEFVHPYLKQMFTDPQTGQYNVQQIKYLTDNFENLDTVTKAQWVELEKTLKKDRAMQKYQNLITKSAYMPNVFAHKLAELSSVNSNVRVAMASFQNVPDEEANPTEEDYKNYYNEHKAEFRVREELRNIEFVAFPINPTQEDMNKIAEEVSALWEEMQTTGDDELGFFVGAESERPYDSSYVKASSFPAPMDSVIAASAAGTMIAPRLVGNTWMMAKVQGTDVRPDSLRASVIWIMNNKAGGNVTRNEEQAKNLTDSVYALLKNGMSFEQAVADFSDSKENNGDQGWALDGGYGFMNEDMLKTPVDGIFTIEHPQKVGHCIVKVTGKTTPSKKYRVAMVTRDIVPSDNTEKNIYNSANQFAGQNRTYAEMIASAQEQNLMVRNDMIQSMAYSVSGMPNAREIVRWAFDKKTEVGSVADQVFSMDNMYIVVALKDVLKKGFATFEQVRPMIENQVRIEKKGEYLMAKAKEAKSNDINNVAAKLGTTVDSVFDVNFSAYYFGKFGMEPKVQAAVACAKANTMIGPIKGAQGVYMVQVDDQTKVINNEEGLKVKAAEIRAQLMQAYGQKANGIVTVLKDNAKIVDQRDLHF